MTPGRKPSLRGARDAARRIAGAHFGRPPRKLSRKGGGLTNVVYMAEGEDGERLVVRMGVEPAKRDDFAKEEWAMRRAAEAGVPVPETLSVGDEHGLPYMLQRAVAGADATHHPDRLAILRELGRLASLVHSVPTKGFGQVFDPAADGFAGAMDWADYVRRELEFENRLDILNRQRMLSRQQASRLEGMLHEIAAWQVRPALNHGDLRLKNVMVDGEPARITALLDWEFCASHVAPYWDLSLALHDLTIDAKQVFLEGYGLGEEEVARMADVMKAFNIINYAPYVARAAEEGDEALLARYRTRFSGALDLYSL